MLVVTRRDVPSSVSAVALPRLATRTSRMARRRPGEVDHAGRDARRRVHAIGFDVDHVARAAHAGTHRLIQREAHARHRAAVERLRVLHLHGRDRMTRVGGEAVFETRRDHIAQLDDERAGVRLRCHIRHRRGRLDGKNPRAAVQTRGDPLEHRRISSGPSGSNRSHHASRHGQAQAEEHRISVHGYLASSVCRSSFRTSRCFSSESGSLTCCRITIESAVIDRIVPSDSLSPTRTM